MNNSKNKAYIGVSIVTLAIIILGLVATYPNEESIEKCVETTGWTNERCMVEITK